MPGTLTGALTRRASALALFVVLSTPAGAQRSDTTVRRAGPPLHAGVATLVEEATLGAGSDAEEYRFTHALVFAAREGGLYVVDMVDPQNVGAFRASVRLYDRTGKFVRAIGRIGQGPGEYERGIGAVKELPDGRILVSYYAGVLVYSPSGEPLDRWSARAFAANMGSPIYVDPAGFVYTEGATTTGPFRPGSGPPQRRPFLYRFRADGTPLDTIATPAVSLPSDSQPRIGRASLPFSPRYLTAWSPLGYFVTAHSATYAIDLRQPPPRTRPGAQGDPATRTPQVDLPLRAEPPAWRPGDPVVSIRHSAPAVPVHDAERADWRQSITMFNRSPTPGRNAGWEWDGPDIPRVKPPLSWLSVDGDGRIWVRLSQPARVNPSVTIPTRPATPQEAYTIDARERWVEPMVFDVLEPSGRYIGQVRFPDGVGQPVRPDAGYVIRGDTVWAVVRDADDVSMVKRYRIRWGG